jgi:predicted HicB family RNase H-like nuclease
MSLLRYKDYQGGVRFEDGRLIIQILHIDDFITTECDSAAAAQSAFDELVDDYLDTCAELKKEPSKPFKGSLNVRMPPALHKRAALRAAERRESINALITQALQTYLANPQMVVDRQAAKMSFAQSISQLRSQRSEMDWVQSDFMREGAKERSIGLLSGETALRMTKPQGQSAWTQTWGRRRAGREVQ